eukprot:Rhum_TRINITY_DN2508_c0_g1::Rhum_TRINITY_DN2508_c0_g1_i1::g.7397::m.7397
MQRRKDTHIDVGPGVSETCEKQQSAARAGLGKWYKRIGFFLLLLAVGYYMEWHHDALRQIRIIGQSQWWLDLQLAVSSGAKATAQKAEEYYNQQMPLVRESARNFKLHDYFSHTKLPNTAVEKLGWYDMIEARTHAMARLLTEQQRDDFRVEKDRCEMYRFFQRAGLPHVPVVSVFMDRKQINALAVSGEMFRNVTKWPVFIKACHLTQGSMSAVMKIESKEWAVRHSAEVVQWMGSKLGRHADDFERPWRAEGNMLTDTLQPGILVQEGWHTVDNPYAGKRTVVELKVEVLWGRAYLAVANDLGAGTIFLRDGTVERYPLWRRTVYSALSDLAPQMQWIFEHLPCVWALAEKAAATIGAECVRIDVFLWKEHPQECTINEISISSGMGYARHFSFLARAWALPFAEKQYSVAGTKDRVYEATGPLT